MSTVLNLPINSMYGWNSQARCQVQHHHAGSVFATKFTDNGENSKVHDASLVVYDAMNSPKLMEDDANKVLTSCADNDTSALFSDVYNNSFVSSTSVCSHYQKPDLEPLRVQNTILAPEIWTGEYSCSNCGVWFRKLLHFSIHCKSCYQRSRYICMACHYHTASQSDLYCHTQRHGLFHKQCPSCHDWFRDFDVFKMHLQIHLLELETCLENDIIFYGDLHDYTEEPKLWKLATPTLSRVKYAAPTYVCTTCNISVRSKFRLWIHQSSQKHSRLNSSGAVVKHET